MKKPFTIILALLCGLQIFSAPASSMVYKYSSKSAVDVDLSVLEEPIPEKETPSPSSAPAPSDMVPLDITRGTALPAPAVEPPEKLTDKPVKPVLSVPRIRLEKPFFTADDGATEMPAEPQQAASKSSLPKPFFIPPAETPETAPVAPLEKQPVKPVVTAPPESPPETLAAPEAEALTPAEQKVTPEKTEEATPEITPPLPQRKPDIANITETNITEPAQPVRDVETVAAPAPQQTEEMPVKTEPAPAATKAVPLLSDLTLEFSPGSSDISPQAQSQLDRIIVQLKEAPEMRIQIRAYAGDDDNGASSARRMSLSRGLIVRSYLAEKEISPKRLDVRALGFQADRQPADRVDLVFVR